MRATTTSATSKRWDARIREKVEEFGLDCYPQEFEVCDHNQMLAYMAYSGMPSHYPHWSYGKSFEKLKTLYDYGVSGLPYEMVINSNPALAYLMRDNSLLLQILTIAHVYGHNDFFKNNFTFTQHPRRVHDRHLQGARAARARATTRIRASASNGSRRSSTPRTRSRCSAGATSRSASSPTRRRGSRARRRRSRGPIRSSASTGRRSTSSPTCARTPLVPGRGPAALHPRPQPVPHRVGEGPPHHRPRGGAVLHPADRDQDHERGLGVVLAQADPRQPRSRPELHARVHRAPQPGRAPASKAASTRTTSACASGKTSTARAGEAEAGDAADLRRAREPTATPPSCAAISPRS